MEYYGPTKEACAAINQLLSLPATGREQDWEIELADSARLDEFISFAKERHLKMDEKCAIASLIMGSIDEAHEKNTLSETSLDSALEWLKTEPIVLKAMRFFFLNQNGSLYPEVATRVLSV